MFGLSFVSPWLLLGVSLSLAPIIIHLLNKRRFKTVRWAAMRFLLDSQRKNRRKIRFEQLLLLLIRTLVLLLLALAIAQPRVEQGSFVALAAMRPNRHVLLLLDHSFSMAYQLENQTVYESFESFEHAKSIAQRILDSLSEGDKVSLFLLSEKPIGIVKEPSYNLKNVSQELEAVKLSHSSTNIPIGLKMAAEIMIESSNFKKEVYLISDFQRSGWNLDQSSKDRDFLNSLKQLSETCEVVFLNTRQAGATNRAVSKIRIPQKMALLGDVTTFEATVENFSPKDESKVVVNFYVDERKQGTAAKNISAWGKTVFVFNHQFRDKDPHTIRIRIEEDRLPIDDSRFLVVQPKDSIRILCIDGQPKPAGEAGETRFLKVALSPTGVQGGSPIVSDIQSPYTIKPSQFYAYNVIILANVARLSPNVVPAIEDFIKEGGSVFVFLGDQIDPNFYNKHFYRSGKGFFPAELEKVVDASSIEENFFYFAPRSFEHPMIAMFKGLTATPLTSVLVYKYIKAKVSNEMNDVTIVCHYNNGDAAILENRFGLGHCLLFTTSCDSTWTNLPQKPVFLPMLHESVYYVLQGIDPRKNLKVGEPFQRILNPEEFGGKFSIRRIREVLDTPQTRTLSNQDSISLAGLPFKNRFILTFEKTERAGVYKVERTDAADNPKYFCVNLPTEESDLRTVSFDAIQKTFPNFKFLHGSEEQILSSSTPQSSHPKALWKTLLWAVLGLLTLESFLAHRFGK